MTPRQQQIAAAPILQSAQEKVVAMSGDMAQDDEELPPFRHWVGSDYSDEAADRDDITPAVRFFQGVIGALAFVAVVGALVGLWIITP